MAPVRFPLAVPKTAHDKDDLLKRLERFAEKADPEHLPSLKLGEPLPPPKTPWAQVYKHYDPCSQPLCEHFHWPAHRARPAIFASALQGATATITKNIQAGKSKYHSQVYLASLCSESLPPEEVVIKVYWSSISKGVKQLGERGMGQGIWKRVLNEFRAEEWAYTQMAALQGLIAPWIGGFFQVCEFPSFRVI